MAVKTKRVLIPLYKDEVAPRFDLAAEALLAEVAPDGSVAAGDTLLLTPSAEGLCDLVLRKDVDAVICGGIEEKYYHYLRWKRVEVLDNVAAKAQFALKRYAAGTLKAGDILFATEDEHAR